MKMIVKLGFIEKEYCEREMDMKNDLWLQALGNYLQYL